MSLEPLQAPAWIVALGTAFFFGAKAVMLVKGGNGNGSFPAELRALLQQTTGTLAALTVRLEQLPTREEIKDVAQANRHSYRQDMSELSGKLEDRIDRAETVILKELTRPA